MDWPFISYDPTTYPPLPQPACLTLRRRLAAFGVKWIAMTGTYVSLTLALHLLATGQL